MSNFILLIMDAYYEKEKNDISIQSKSKLSDLIKENKLIFFMLILLGMSLISFEAFSFISIKHGKLYGTISLIIYFALFLVLVPLFQKTSQKNYDKHINTYKLRLKFLREILKDDFGLYEHGKIQELISQSDLIIDRFKLSKEIFKPIVSLTKSVIFPIIAFSLGLITKNTNVGLTDTLVLTTILVLTVLMVLGIFYLVKMPIEDYLDSTSNKVKWIKGMLIDIDIMDFVKAK